MYRDLAFHNYRMLSKTHCPSIIKIPRDIDESCHFIKKSISLSKLVLIYLAWLGWTVTFSSLRIYMLTFLYMY